MMQAEANLNLEMLVKGPETHWDSLLRKIQMEFSTSVSFITGVMLGIEFPPTEVFETEDGNPVKFAVVLDLLILRITAVFV